MSHLAFHSHTSAAIYLSGREVHHILALARDALVDELSLPEHRQLRAGLGLPAPDSMFFSSQVFCLMTDGEAQDVQGGDVYAIDLALNVLYQRQPAAGILCWLFDKAIEHGWVAGADREAMAGQMQAALDGGVARPGMGWDAIISFLRGGTDDVVTSTSLGREFPDYQLAWETGVWQPAIPDPDDRGEELEIRWDQLGDDEQWDLCMRALQTRPALRWQPASDYNFGAFTLAARAGPGRVPARPGRQR